MTGRPNRPVMGCREPGWQIGLQAEPLPDQQPVPMPTADIPRPPILRWVGRDCPQRAARCPGLPNGPLNYYMRKSAQSAKILGTPPERGHSCPQQLPNAQRDRKVRELYFRSTLLRTGMSALRFGSGSAGLGTDAPYHPAVTEALPFVPARAQLYSRRMKTL